MKVFSIYINETEGHLIVCATSEEEALQFVKADEDSPLFERDLTGQAVDIYEERNLCTPLTDPTLISWMINENVNF